MNFNRVPVRQWKHREFDGVDPWATNRPVRWSIVTFRMVPVSMVRSAACDRQSAPSETNDIPKKYAIGVYVESNGRYRILPRALATAWRRREVLDPDLPRLLYQGEEQLRRKNDQPGPPRGRALVHAIVVGIIALGIASYYVRLLILSR